MEEQNTNEVEIKEKNPKRVAAGKLARKNAEARKLNRGVESEENLEETKSVSFSDISYGIQSAAGIVGAGFVLYNGWVFLYPHINKIISKKDEKYEKLQKRSETYEREIELLKRREREQSSKTKEIKMEF